MLTHSRCTSWQVMQRTFLTFIVFFDFQNNPDVRISLPSVMWQGHILFWKFMFILADPYHIWCCSGCQLTWNSIHYCSVFLFSWPFFRATFYILWLVLLDCIGLLKHELFTLLDDFISSPCLKVLVFQWAWETLTCFQVFFENCFQCRQDQTAQQRWIWDSSYKTPISPQDLALSYWWVIFPGSDLLWCWLRKNNPRASGHGAPKCSHTADSSAYRNTVSINTEMWWELQLEHHYEAYPMKYSLWPLKDQHFPVMVCKWLIPLIIL